jgi:Domain of unknown function (DUF4249)
MLRKRQNQRNRSTALKNHKFPILALVVITLIFGACDNSFSPKTDFTEELIVFAVLDNTSPVQVVHLSTTYDAELGNIGASRGREIDSARVEIREGGELYVFLDTLIERPDGTHYRVWYYPDLQAKPNKQYRLKVEVEGFPTATADLRVPSSPQVDMQVKHTRLFIDSIRLYSNANFFIVQPKGYFYRLELKYNDSLDGKPFEIRREVPIGQLNGSQELIYPSVGRQTSQSYTKFHIVNTLRSITTDKTKFYKVGAVGTMYAIGPDFYNYFKLVRGFDDPSSVRLDLPDYTNINDARGVFGAVYRDTTFSELFKFYNP